MVGIASEISAGTEPDPPVQDGYNLIHDRCWLSRCLMLQLPALAGDHAHRPEFDLSSPTCRYAVMHIFSVNSSMHVQNQLNRSHWVAFQLHNDFGLIAMPDSSCDHTIPSLSESVLCDEGGAWTSVLFEDLTSSRLPAVGASLGALEHRTTLMEK